MAIIFNKQISENSLLMVFNNNVVRFRSDNTVLQSNYAEITYLGKTLKLFPNPFGEYYFNFSDFIKNIINSNNFADNLETDIEANGYVYSWIYSHRDSVIQYKVYLSDATIETTTRNYSWLLGAVQLEDYKRRYPLFISKLNTILLSPFVENNNNKGYLKYWAGYPFDITIYTESDLDTNLKITNQTNLLFTDLLISSSVNRIAFCDGRVTETIETVLPLQFGLNEMVINNNNSNHYFDLVKEEDNCGVYLKWRNSFGGWNYWLFPKGTRNRTTKDIGELENDFSNIEDTISPTIQIGKNSFDTFTVTTEILTKNDMSLISDMIESPKVYLFTGKPYAQNTFNDWIEVSLKTTDFRIENAKTDFNRFNFAFELPMRNTVTL